MCIGRCACDSKQYNMGSCTMHLLTQISLSLSLSLSHTVKSRSKFRAWLKVYIVYTITKCMCMRVLHTLVSIGYHILRIFVLAPLSQQALMINH